MRYGAVSKEVNLNLRMDKNCRKVAWMDTLLNPTRVLHPPHPS